MTGVAVTVEPCIYQPPARARCKRAGKKVVPGVAGLLCTQHARIVATEPGQSGVVRKAPTTLAEVVAELNAATVEADIRRCIKALCEDPSDAYTFRTQLGLRPEVVTALRAAKARVRGGHR